MVGGWGMEGVCACLCLVCDSSYIIEGRSVGVKVKAVRLDGHSVNILRYRVKHMRE